MMTRVMLLLLACSPAWAQQPTESRYKFDEFMLIEKVEDQEKVYNEMLKALPADKVTPAATNNHRAELAYGWLAKGNIERYRYYKATNPKFSPRQLVYLCNALESLTDVKRQYADVEQISRELLDDLHGAGVRCARVGEVRVYASLSARLAGRADHERVALECDADTEALLAAIARAHVGFVGPLDVIPAINAGEALVARA